MSFYSNPLIGDFMKPKYYLSPSQLILLDLFLNSKNIHKMFKLIHNPSFHAAQNLILSYINAQNWIKLVARVIHSITSSICIKHIFTYLRSTLTHTFSDSLL